MDSPAELAALREATRVRLNTKTIKLLRELADGYAACGDRDDITTAHGLYVLLDMHDKLEAIRNA